MYEKLGFVVLAERPNYYGPGRDAYMMELASIPEVNNV
jgi:ribosomal protein S18 acetylase RimI-like enzyme